MIYCNQCYKPLTRKEKGEYSIQWQYSGDMYCKKDKEQNEKQIQNKAD